jgi:hypothetical protein
LAARAAAVILRPENEKYRYTRIAAKQAAAAVPSRIFIIQPTENLPQSRKDLNYHASNSH